MLVLIFFLSVLSIFLSYDRNRRYWAEKLGLLLGLYAIYICFVLVSNSYVDDPLRNYYSSPDQLTFYTNSLGLSHHSMGFIFKDAFTSFWADESPLAYLYFAVLMKVARFLDADMLLFVKLNVAYLSALLSIVIYKGIRLFRPSGSIVLPIVVFALVSPMLQLSAQMIRDIHVALLYALAAYIVLNERLPFRLPSLIIICVMSYFFRKENGMFAMGFIAIQQYEHFRRSNIFMKLLIVVAILGVTAYMYAQVASMMTETQSGYSERAMAAASNDSFGVMLANLPFPLNCITTFALSQIVPFPCWRPFWGGPQPYDWLRITDRIIPFYWAPIMGCIILMFSRFWKKIDLKYRFLFLLSVLFLILLAISEINLRRQFAIYPLLFMMYIGLAPEYPCRYKLCRKYVFLSLVLLHAAYLVIK